MRFLRPAKAILKDANAGFSAAECVFWNDANAGFNLPNLFSKMMRTPVSM